MSKTEESSKPSQDPDLILDDAPEGDAPALKRAGPDPKTFHERMQGRLISLFTVLLIGAILVGGGGWLFTEAELRDWVSFTAPIFTLSGSALAYYFGTSRNDD
ncbi:hypothetical protein [Brachybacterium sp. UNK5269]|uniref:hypothetical protein n=1 Tax=Brachybacterium sp. UNK5269 TaxID=3408576 RepID=UPI003BB1FBA7